MTDTVFECAHHVLCKSAENLIGDEFDFQLDFEHADSTASDKFLVHKSTTDMLK